MARSGLSVEGLRKIERDRVCPLDDTLLLLARALHLTNRERTASLLAAAQVARAATRSTEAAHPAWRHLQQASRKSGPLPGDVARLPAPLTSFVGRREAIARLVALLQPHGDGEQSGPEA